LSGREALLHCIGRELCANRRTHGKVLVAALLHGVRRELALDLLQDLDERNETRAAGTTKGKTSALARWSSSRISSSWVAPGVRQASWKLAV